MFMYIRENLFTDTYIYIIYVCMYYYLYIGMCVIIHMCV